MDTFWKHTRGLFGNLLWVTNSIINFIGFVLIQASGEYSELPRGVYYSVVSGMGCGISSLLLIFYFLHITDKTRNWIPWFKIELGYCVIWISLHLIAALLTIGLDNGYFNTAAYFAFAALITYALEAVFNVCRITISST